MRSRLSRSSSSFLAVAFFRCLRRIISLSQSSAPGAFSSSMTTEHFRLLRHCTLLGSGPHGLLRSEEARLNSPKSSRCDRPSPHQKLGCATSGHHGSAHFQAQSDSSPDPNEFLRGPNVDVREPRPTLSLLCSYAAASSSSPTANRAKRRITMFSPNSAIFDATRSLIVLSGSLIKA
jgi:hypothetical protein